MTLRSKGPLFSAVLLAGFFMQQNAALACACGCGLFDVSTSGILPTGPGGTAFLEYNFLDQNRNWHNASSAPAEDNDDKEIRSHFLTLGGQYMFGNGWGVQGSVPYWQRYFKTETDDGTVAGFNTSSIGDIRLQAIYTGFSSTMSSGITFGVKLPTGEFHAENFDRDTQIGTGSTDLLLGAYHQGRLDTQAKWDWFTHVQLDLPAIISAGYRPGAEVDVSTGVYYNALAVGPVAIAPILQVLAAYHLHDRGPAADPDNSGYSRVLLSPGVEFNVHRWRVNADVAFPVFEDMRGNQLVARELYTVTLSHDF